MTHEEVKESPFAQYAQSSEREGYWVAMKSTKLLPADSTVTVTIGPNVSTFIKQPINLTHCSLSPQTSNLIIGAYTPVQADAKFLVIVAGHMVRRSSPTRSTQDRIVHDDALLVRSESARHRRFPHFDLPHFLDFLSSLGFIFHLPKVP